MTGVLAGVIASVGLVMLGPDVRRFVRSETGLGAEVAIDGNGAGPAEERERRERERTPA